MDIARMLQDNISIPSEIILNRRKALAKALSLIDEYDVLLILGKGPENYINIKGKRHYHSDIDTIKELIR